jgi:hypothetical protein
MSNSASSQAAIKKLGLQQVLLYFILIAAFFMLLQTVIMPTAVAKFVTYLFAPSGEAREKIGFVKFDGLTWASTSKENEAKLGNSAGAPSKDVLNKEYIFDFTMSSRSMDQNGYIKSSIEWYAKSPVLGENAIILEPWIGFWILSLVASIALSTLITILLPTSIGFMAVLFDRQIDNTKAKIRLQTGLPDDIVELLTAPEDKLEAVDHNTAEIAFRVIWNRTEAEASTMTKKPLEFDDVFDENTDLATFREIQLYPRIKEFFSEFVLKEIEDTKNGLLWRRNHVLLLKGLRLYMSHHFTEKYSNLVQGLAYSGAAVLIVTVGIRGLKFIPPTKPSIILFSTFLEFSMLALLAFTLIYTEEEERMDKMLKKMEDGNRSQLEALKSQQHDIHQLANVLVGQSAEIIKARVESAITEYMTSDDNIKRVVAEEISEKILLGMREAFSTSPTPKR